MRLASLGYGALAGGVATAPMTIAMEVLRRRLPEHHQYPLPPREITEQTTGTVGVRHRLGEEQHTQASLAAHFAFGAAAGAVYGVVTAPLRPNPILGGTLFGLLVWSVSYFGWLPAIGLHRGAREEPVGRNLLMIAAHLVWGATAGSLAELLSPEEGRRTQGVAREKRA
jgi:uncharacterized membrane protein YagU involved in acid resistance